MLPVAVPAPDRVPYNPYLHYHAFPRIQLWPSTRHTVPGPPSARGDWPIGAPWLGGGLGETQPEGRRSGQRARISGAGQPARHGVKRDLGWRAWPAMADECCTRVGLGSPRRPRMGLADIDGPRFPRPEWTAKLRSRLCQFGASAQFNSLSWSPRSSSATRVNTLRRALGYRFREVRGAWAQHWSCISLLCFGLGLSARLPPLLAPARPFHLHLTAISLSMNLAPFTLGAEVGPRKGTKRQIATSSRAINNTP